MKKRQQKTQATPQLCCMFHLPLLLYLVFYTVTECHQLVYALLLLSYVVRLKILYNLFQISGSPSRLLIVS